MKNSLCAAVSRGATDFGMKGSAVVFALGFDTGVSAGRVGAAGVDGEVLSTLGESCWKGSAGSGFEATSPGFPRFF